MASSDRAAGVATPEELRSFVEQAGTRLLVVDIRNTFEPEDIKSVAEAALPSTSHRPQAQNLIWDRSSGTMPLPNVPLDTPIITHCGAGRRGQKAKEYLVKHGFTNVINGGKYHH
jgi:rhodanese-related sulfurtransferase